MMNLTEAEKRGFIRDVLEESGDARLLSDVQLDAFLEKTGGDPMGAVYLGALFKARADGVTLPDGTVIQSNRAYWQSIAAAFRPNRGGAVRREEVKNK